MATESQVLDAVARQRMLNQRFAKEVFEGLLGGRGGYQETLQRLRETAASLERGGGVWLTETLTVRVPAAQTEELAETFRMQLDVIAAMERVARRISGTRWVRFRRRLPGVAELSGLCEEFQRLANRATVLVSEQLTASRDTAERGAREAGEQLQEVLHMASANARDAEGMARDTSHSALKIMGGVHSVAVATEELTESIREISLQARTAAESACTAGDALRQSNDCMAGLGGAAEGIGEVLKLLVGVAERSNMLALNASIEAARAGEAGRGFDVVAQEVKGLAMETRTATEEIGMRVGAIQAGTRNAMVAIAQINGVMEQVRGASGGIATVVEQQTVAAREIARSMHEAAEGVSAVNEHIAAVARAAEHTSRTAAEGLQVAGEMTGARRG